MRLHLARWENTQGSSAGNWLLREVAGLGVTRDPAGWQIKLVLTRRELRGLERLRQAPPAPLTVLLLPSLDDLRARQLWGEDYTIKPACDLLAQPRWQRSFATRAALLDALAGALAPATDAPAQALERLPRND